MSVVHADDTNFEAEVLKSDKLVVVDFYADWCGPCKMFGPILEEYAGNNPDIKAVKVNTDKAPQVSGQFGIRSIPTVIIFKDGEAVKQQMGAMSMDMLEEFVKSAG